jgi:hypothetical protein
MFPCGQSYACGWNRSRIMPVVEDDDDGRVEDVDGSGQVRRVIESDLHALGVTLEGLDIEAESPPHKSRNGR